MRREEFFVRQRESNNGEVLPQKFTEQEILSQFANRLRDYQYSRTKARWISCARLDPDIQWDVFISCSSKHYKIAGEIKRWLEDRRLRTFLAAEDILQTMNWRDTLSRAISRCHVVVFLGSQEAYASDVVKEEVDWAKEQHKSLVPFMLDDAKIPVDWGMRLTSPNRIDTRGEWKTYQEALVDRVFSALSQSPEPLSVTRRIKNQFKEWGKALAYFTAQTTAVILIVLVTIGVVSFVIIRNLVPAREQVPVQVPESVPEGPLAIVASPQAVTFFTAEKTTAEKTNSKKTAADAPKSFTVQPQNNYFLTQYLSKEDPFKPEMQQYRLNPPQGALAVFQLSDPLSSPSSATPSAEAALLTEIGKHLEKELRSRQLDETSYVFAHVNRSRCLFVWRRANEDQLSRNWLAWPAQPKAPGEPAHDWGQSPLAGAESLESRLKDQESRKPSVLSMKTVILCGEVPAFAHLSSLESQKQIESINHRVPAFGLASSFAKGPPLEASRFGDSRIQLWIAGSKLTAEDFALLERLRQRLPEILRVLKMEQNRELVLLPSLF